MTVAVNEGSAAPKIKKGGMSLGPHNTPPPNVVPGTLFFVVKSPLRGFKWLSRRYAALSG